MNTKGTHKDPSNNSLKKTPRDLASNATNEKPAENTFENPEKEKHRE
jgi:hypothetical protein